MTDQFPPWWTEERLIELKARWAAGETSSEIGRALHNSRNAIIGKSHRVGLLCDGNTAMRAERKAAAQRRKAQAMRERSARSHIVRKVI